LFQTIVTRHLKRKISILNWYYRFEQRDQHPAEQDDHYYRNSLASARRSSYLRGDSYYDQGDDYYDRDSRYDRDYDDDFTHNQDYDRDSRYYDKRASHYDDRYYGNDGYDRRSLTYDDGYQEGGRGSRAANYA
jgi:hypothetical protein